MCASEAATRPRLALGADGLPAAPMCKPAQLGSGMEPRAEVVGRHSAPLASWAKPPRFELRVLIHLAQHFIVEMTRSFRADRVRSQNEKVAGVCGRDMRPQQLAESITITVREYFGRVPEEDSLVVKVGDITPFETRSIIQLVFPLEIAIVCHSLYNAILALHSQVITSRKVIRWHQHEKAEDSDRRTLPLVFYLLTPSLTRLLAWAKSEHKQT